ncbi:MAG: 50S ribosomal protein L11 methyltransferase, partial [Verrucomicrobiae bacterium]|nr:50S ribosomal protein L11 methyltransferase [Verrucomicrobiae bacterium]
LDVGPGSGIIAIAAAKLGYAPVRAIDIDPDSIRTATANARRNRVHRRIQFLVVDLCRLPQESWPRHHIVCANLNLDLLLTSGKKLSALLQPGGFLILAGVLHSEFPIVENHYAQLGFRLVRSKVDGGWRSGTFVLST